MIVEQERELEATIRSTMSPEEIVSLLRRYKDQGINQDDVYTFLHALRQRGLDENTDDRVVEVADFMAGFCSPHMRIWDDRCLQAWGFPIHPMPGG